MSSQLPFVEQIIKDLRRFKECAEDDNDVYLERSRFDLLVQLGLLERVQRSPARWMMTQAGEDAIARPAAGEPLYQLRKSTHGTGWRDADKEAYESAADLVQYERRILYTAPPAAAHGDESALPDNLRSHRLAWLNALERLIDLEPGGLDPTAEDLNGYWCHELQAMRDMYADLDRIDAMRAQGDDRLLFTDAIMPGGLT